MAVIRSFTSDSIDPQNRSHYWGSTGRQGVSLSQSSGCRYRCIAGDGAGSSGHTFLLVIHAGRKTGKLHSIVAMALTYDPDTHEAVICSAWGEKHRLGSEHPSSSGGSDPDRAGVVHTGAALPFER